jgi:hypothetical protein
VYVYFGADGSSQDLKINWAIHPIGPPFRGKQQPLTFDYILKITDIDCDDHLKSDLKLAMIRMLSDKYHSQEAFPSHTPIYHRTSEEVLVLWEHSKLDIDQPGTIDEIKGPLTTSFGFSISNLDIEFLTKLGKVGTPIFESNRWLEILCFHSQPSSISRDLNDKRGSKSNESENTLEPTPGLDNKLKRKSDDSGNAPESSSSKRLAISTIPEKIPCPTDVLRRNLTISKWFRLELDISDDSNLEAVRQWLNKTYDVESEVADVKKITGEAKLAKKSPLRSTAFQSLVAEASIEISSALINPLRSRSKSSSSQLRSLSASFIKRENIA